MAELAPAGRSRPHGVRSGARRGAIALAVLATAVAGGCGGGMPVAEAPADERTWRADVDGVLHQLRVDIAATSVGGSTRAAAARALSSTSHLYALLVAYSDLGGCRAMVARAQAPPRVTRPLQAACVHLERAAALFARAAQDDDPDALARATQEVRRAQPQLVRASLALRR